jgi:hypothetical protein
MYKVTIGLLERYQNEHRATKMDTDTQLEKVKRQCAPRDIGRHIDKIKTDRQTDKIDNIGG